FHVLVALGMTATWYVGMGELIHQYQARVSFDCCIEIEFAQNAIDVDSGLARQNVKALQQCFCFLATMGFNHTNDDVDTLFEFGARRLEHFIGLANSRSGADEDLQTTSITALFSPHFCKQSLGRGTLILVISLVCHDRSGERWKPTFLSRRITSLRGGAV